MTDIVERLRHPVGIVTARTVDLYNEAADEITRLRKALEPFAHYFDVNDCNKRHDDDALEVPIGDLRRASQTLRIVGVPSTLAEGES